MDQVDQIPLFAAFYGSKRSLRADRSLHSELPQGLGTVIEELLRRQAVATRRADDLTMVGVTGVNVGEPPPASCWRTEVEVTRLR